MFNFLERENVIIIKDNTNVEGCHAYYSSYIPLKMQAKFDDELDNTFTYLKHLQEKGRGNDRHNILNEITEHMTEMRERR